MLVDDRALPWTHERSLPVQRTGCSWMLVTSHGPMSDSYLCSAQDARGCSWMHVLSHGPMSDSYLCSAHDARGCSYLCSAQDARGCSWMLRRAPENEPPRNCAPTRSARRPPPEKLHLVDAPTPKKLHPLDGCLGPGPPEARKNAKNLHPLDGFCWAEANPNQAEQKGENNARTH